jgi:membrane protein required for colicin V production
MNWVDIVLGVFVVVFLVIGVRKGLIREVAGFIGLVVAFIVGIAGTRFWSELIVIELHFPPSIATVVSFILLFTLVFLLFRAAGSFLFTILHLSPLGWLDRVGGCIVGLLKGALIVSLVLLILGTLSLPQAVSRPLDSSTLASPMRGLAPAVYHLLKIAFPQMRSLGEVVGQSVERSFARGKEEVLEKRSHVVDMLQKAKAAPDDKADSQGRSESEETPDKK